jgi:hypothetical protein
MIGLVYDPPNWVTSLYEPVLETFYNISSTALWIIPLYAPGFP